MPNLSEWSLKHPQMVLFLLVLFSVAGLYAYRHLGQKEDPDFTIKAMLVRAYWPGANAREMSEQVTDRLERKLQEIAEIDYTTSYSRAGEAQITVVLREETTPERVPDAWYLVRTKLNDIKSAGELPQGVKGPFYNDDFGDTYGNLYAITGEGFSYPELRDFADTARNELLRVRDVSKVEIEGDQEQKIYVEASRAKLASLGVDPALIAQQLSATNVVAPAGIVQAGSERVRVDVTGEYQSVESIRNIGIRAGDRVFRVGDIADVRRDVADPPTARLRFQGLPAVGLAVSMRKGGDVIALGHDLDEVVARIKASLPVGVDIRPISDQPKVVKSSVNEFTHSLFEAVAIVLLVSFFSLGMRTGLVVALSIPLVLAMTFLCMYLAGIELQRISLGALIISLGLLVDDAIIAVEMMALKMEQGWDRFRAATYAYTATAFPMLTGTLITAAGFMPVGFARSNVGQYVISLFQVVGISLVLSWIVAVVFTPYLGYHLLPEHKGGHVDEDAVYQRGFYVRFRHAVEACLAHRRMVIAVTIAAFVAALALFRVVPQQFFPASERPEIMVQLWLPEAATTSETEAQVREFESRLQGDPDIVAVTSYVGRGSPRFYLPLDVQSPNVALAELMVMTKGKEARARVTDRLQKVFESDFASVRGRVLPLENGPSVGYPVQFRVSGPETGKVREISEQVGAAMRAHPNLLRVNTDWSERTKILRVDVDQDKARLLGITSSQVAEGLQQSISGRTITQYREGDKSIDVVSRLPEEERTDLNNLRDTKIYLSKGKFVPVSQVARLTLASEDSVYWRRNRVPTMTVRADVSGAEAPDVTAQLLPKMDALRKALPLGYSITAGGATESSATAQASIKAVMPAMFLVVLVLLMLQLQDMKKMALVLATAPLGVIGVSVVLAVFRIPFGFVALLGVIALFGMIIRNSVILVVQIDHDLSRGLAPWDAIVESTVRRFRPIVLTALAAILAMIPLTRSTFWGPMAWAIMGGLAVATLLTLLFLPALYAAAYGAVKPGTEAAATPATKPRRAWKTRFAFASALLAMLPGAQAVDLVGAYSRATGADPTIQAAHEAAAAGAEKAVQGRALYLPRVTLSNGVTYIRDRSDLGEPLSGFVGESTSGTVRNTTVQASQPIYRPQDWAQARQLKEQSGLAVIEHRQAQYDLIERVTQAYFGVLLAEEGVRVSQAQKAAVGEQLERSRARFEVGKARATDVEEAQARHDSALASEISASGKLDLARAQFHETTGLPAAGLAGFGARFVATAPQPDSLDAWIARTLEQNPRVQSKRSQVSIAAADIDKYRLAGRPTVDLVASYSDKGSAGGLSPLVAPDRQRTSSIGVQVSIPLFAGGSYESRERESRAKHREAQHDLSAAERDARLQVRDAFNAVKNGAARTAALDQAVVSASTSLESTIAGRDVGTKTTTEVLDAQQRLSTAQLDLAQARYDYLLGRVRLAEVAGDLDEGEVRRLNAFLR